MAELPDEIMGRFRGQAIADVEALEVAWANLCAHPDAVLGLEMQRRAHRLKGDARVMGLGDINLVCQRLEDLLASAQRLDYQISEELELVVTMALRFIALLLTKQPGTAQTGLDLPGFMEATDAVLRDHRGSGPAQERMPRGPAFPVDTRLPSSVRFRLRQVAVEVFIARQRSGEDAQRLQQSWSSLNAMLCDDTVQLSQRLSHHAAATRALARQLGKQIHLTMQLGEVLVPSHVGELLNTTLLHLCANAVDHGIEDPAERQAHGKPPLGQIRVVARELPEALSLTVSDDGRGVDFSEVRQRAVAARLIAEDAYPTEDELSYLLFYPRFSLRDRVDGISGRGIGLDAVKSMIAADGGSIRLSSRVTAGTEVTVLLPLAPRRLQVHLFEGPVPFCVPAEYAISDEPDDEPTDPLRRLGIVAPAELTLRLRGPGFDGGWRVPGRPRPAECDRGCTCPPQPVEVVSLDGRELLLIRPGRA